MTPRLRKFAWVCLCLLFSLVIHTAQLIDEIDSVDRFYEAINSKAPQDDGVTDIDDDRLVFVHFYAMHCGYCQQLKPIMNEVAQHLHENDINIKLIQVDGSLPANEEIIEKEAVDGYPSLYLYRNGQFIHEYQGIREKKNIIDYLQLKSSTLSTLPEVDSIRQLIPVIHDLEKGVLLKNGVLAIVIAVFLPLNLEQYRIRPNEKDLDASELSHDKEDFIIGQMGDMQSSTRRKEITESDRKYFDLNGYYDRALEIADKKKHLYQISHQFDLAVYYTSSSPEIVHHFQIQEDTLILYTGEPTDTYHKIPFHYTENDNSDIHSLLVNMTMPLSIPFSYTNLAILSMLPVRSHALVFYDSETAYVDNHLLDQLLITMQKFKGKLMAIEVSSEEFALMQYFHIRTSDLPQLVIVDMEIPGQYRRYSFVDYLSRNHPQQLIQSTTNSDSIHDILKKRSIIKKVYGEEEFFYFYESHQIEEFCLKYLAKELPPSIQSETLTELQLEQSSKPSDDNSVIEVIVGSQFQEKVIESSEDILLYIHARWCIHCKALEPVIDEVSSKLSQMMQTNSDMHPIKIVKIDGSVNEIYHEKIHVLGFPTLYFLDHSNKLQHVTEYVGGHTVEDLLAFIAEQKIEN